MATNLFYGSSPTPGVSTNERMVDENNVLQGRWEHTQWFQGTIASTCVDTNSSVTTNLRNGLLLGKDSNGEYTIFDPTGLVANSTKRLDAILLKSLSMLGVEGSVEDKQSGALLATGIVDPSKLVYAASSSRGIVGNAYEYHIRKQLAASGNFIFEDEPVEVPLFHWKYEDAKTADYTLTEADRDVLWTNEGDDGAIEFTLPTTAKKDLAYYFYVVANQNLTVTAGTADTIIALNNAAADGVAFSTTNQKIGGSFAVIGDGAKWKVFNLSAGANTVTVVSA
jgi:hypothetical protein